MKIHDKFVIELAEVIKAYGNDPTVKDPLKIPCDYKFYEISGVAICEKSFKKMKRLDDEINSILDEIKAEINNLTVYHTVKDGQINLISQNAVNRIIDKYKAGEEQEMKVRILEDIDKEEISKAVVLLDLFTKTYCRYPNDYDRFNDLTFRCDECPFYKDNADCLVKIFKNKYAPNYRDFGSMGDL